MKFSNAPTTEKLKPITPLSQVKDSTTRGGGGGGGGGGNFLYMT